MYMKSYSPCYMFSLDEPLLNYTILKMCSKYYIPEGADPKDDCYLSPLTTPNEVWFFLIKQKDFEGISRYGYWDL